MRVELAPSQEVHLNERITHLSNWLRENAPHVFDEQIHLDEGTEERAYWHYGYLVALRDLQNLIFDKSSTSQLISID